MKKEIPLTDAELIVMILAGNRRGFTLLFDRYYPSLLSFNYGRYKTDPARAECETMKLMMVLYEKIMDGTYINEDKCKAWLLKAAVNIHLNTVKKDKQMPTISLDKTHETTEESNDGALHHEELLVELAIQHGKLSKKWKRIIILKFTYDLTWEEIAKVVDGTATGLSSQYAKLLERLRKIFKELKLF